MKGAAPSGIALSDLCGDVAASKYGLGYETLPTLCLDLSCYEQTGQRMADRANFCLMGAIERSQLVTPFGTLKLASNVMPTFNRQALFHATARLEL